MLTVDEIRQAHKRIADTLSPTPVLPEAFLSSAMSRRVLLKCELFQQTGSFKPRGGLNWIRTAEDADSRCRCHSNVYGFKGAF